MTCLLCPQHIIPGFTAEEIREALEPVEKQMQKWEEDHKKLREQLAQLSKKNDER